MSTLCKTRQHNEKRRESNENEYDPQRCVALRIRIARTLLFRAPQEPFSILPLEVICNTIEANVWELHDAHSTEAAAAARRAPPRQASAYGAQPPPPQTDADELVAAVAAPGFRW